MRHGSKTDVLQHLGLCKFFEEMTTPLGTLEVPSGFTITCKKQPPVKTFLNGIAS